MNNPTGERNKHPAVLGPHCASHRKRMKMLRIPKSVTKLKAFNFIWSGCIVQLAVLRLDAACVLPTICASPIFGSVSFNSCICSMTTVTHPQAAVSPYRHIHNYLSYLRSSAQNSCVFLGSVMWGSLDADGVRVFSSC